MWNKIQRWSAIITLGTAAALGGMDCSGSDSGFGYDSYSTDSYGYSDSGDYYGFYEPNTTHSFVTGPGLDAGDSLETYLGSFVSYP